MRGYPSLRLALAALMILAVALPGCGAPQSPYRYDADPAHLAKITILNNQMRMMDTQGEVDGEVQNTDVISHDVTLDATFLDSGGRAIGSATGVAEDVPSGQSGSFVL